MGICDRRLLPRLARTGPPAACPGLHHGHADTAGAQPLPPGSHALTALTASAALDVPAVGRQAGQRDALPAREEQHDCHTAAGRAGRGPWVPGLGVGQGPSASQYAVT